MCSILYGPIIFLYLVTGLPSNIAIGASASFLFDKLYGIPCLLQGIFTSWQRNKVFPYVWPEPSHVHINFLALIFTQRKWQFKKISASSGKWFQCSVLLSAANAAPFSSSTNLHHWSKPSHPGHWFPLIGSVPNSLSPSPVLLASQSSLPSFLNGL
jgi:hypothetical protein